MGIIQVTSVDGSVGVTNPTGPIVDLSVPPASGYASLTGPGKTATPGALTQQGGFYVNSSINAPLGTPVGVSGAIILNETSPADSSGNSVIYIHSQNNSIDIRSNGSGNTGYIQLETLGTGNIGLDAYGTNAGVELTAHGTNGTISIGAGGSPGASQGQVKVYGAQGVAVQGGGTTGIHLNDTSLIGAGTKLTSQFNDIELQGWDAVRGNILLESGMTGGTVGANTNTLILRPVNTAGATGRAFGGLYVDTPGGRIGMFEGTTAGSGVTYGIQMGTQHGFRVDDFSGTGIQLTANSSGIIQLQLVGGSGQLYFLGLPTTNPGLTGAVWNSGGVLHIA